MSAIRCAAALLVIGAAAGSLYLFCLLPYRCNVVKKARLGTMRFAVEQSSSFSGHLAARRNIDAFLPCMSALCRDVSLDLLIAANYRLVGRPEEAIPFYLDALRRDTRPEIYLNLAATELALGNRDAAREHALRATLFNVGMLADIDDGLLRDETAGALIRLYPEKSNEIRSFQTYVPPQ